ncbi:MAG TPA: threonine--tRNA ligase [Spirochaetota bacterium]|nr:threonine--tRNA ligase [Spirochaetota bacterium]
MAGQITITLPDSTTLQAERGATVFDVIGAIGKGLQKAALAARVNGTPVDLASALDADAALQVITFDGPEGRDVFWHSGSHLMAQAVKRLFPDARPTIGPAVDNGFYYDFDTSANFTPEDLERIEAEMRKIVAEDLPVVREEMDRAKAIELFRAAGESYKVELLSDLDAETVSVYRQGEFVDLCRGPHVPRTSYLKAFKLLTIAGAYWRGDERNKMLQRIYGVAFPDEKQLKKHLQFLEEAKKRDHRRLGRELDLFSVHDETGAGLILWHPKGARLRNLIEDFWREQHYRNGYEMVVSPHIGKSQLWQTSGHLDFYNENMYSPMDIDGQNYYVKPMNCPFHIVMYNNRGWSYRDLPLRWAELGTVYRYERSGVLHGLLRVRGFTQDDAHLYVRPDQMPDEIDRVLAFSLYMLRSFGFQDFKVYLATRPSEKSVGEESMWRDAIAALEASVKRAGIDYEVDEGGGAFYGPKIDIKIKDVLGREWQCSTIQFDFNLPERFDMTYIDTDGKKHRPYMIHRALLGSLERFIGILIEHHGGRFPVWLAPVQAVIVTVNPEHADYAKGVEREMIARGLRAECDLREETIGYKVREAITRHVPYVAVVGAKEVESGTLAVRRRGENSPETLAAGAFMDRLAAESAERK